MTGNPEKDAELDHIALTVKSRLAPLPFEPGDSGISRITRYTALFKKWNSRFSFSNYTTIDEILDSLIIPSLAMSLLIPENLRILDLGSGPGIPGIPLMIIRPDLKVSCLEAGSKQVEFMETCKSELDLDGLQILEGRAEDLAHDPQLRSTYDLVIARAFAPLPVVIEIASAFIKPGGQTTVQCPGSASSETSIHNKAMQKVGALFDFVGAIDLDVENQAPLYFIRFSQSAESSKAHPRSWKMMKKQPLWA